MKVFIIILFLLPSFALADSCFFPLGKPGANASYQKKSQCDQAEAPDKCFNICEGSGIKDFRRWMVGQVDDLNDPIFRAAESSPVKLDCDNDSDCMQKAMDPNGDSNFDDQVCIADNSTPRWDELANWPGITGVTGPWFIWCSKHSGTFRQKSVLISDVAGSTQADIDDAQKASDKSARETAKIQRDLNLDQCVADSKASTLTLPQASSCIRALVRKARGESVPVGEL